MPPDTPASPIASGIARVVIDAIKAQFAAPPAIDLATLARLVAQELRVKSDVPKLVSQTGAWRYVGLSRSAWFRAKAAGEIPAGVELPGTGCHWRTADLDQWVSRLKCVR